MNIPSRVDQIRTILQRELPALAKQYRVASLGLFGSYVRGENRPDSDLDVLVTFSETPSLFRYVELEDHLSKLLGVRVDLVMREGLKPAIGQRILAELMPV
jgi:predicted nucleotidyltransferase